jgi:hypothetical protein
MYSPYSGQYQSRDSSRERHDPSRVPTHYGVLTDRDDENRLIERDKERQRHELPGDNNLDILTVIEGWLHTCLDDHAGCEDRELEGLYPDKSPILLIDVVQLCLVQKTTEVRFVALSYVWGEVNQLRTRIKTFERLQTPLALLRSWEQMPARWRSGPVVNLARAIKRAIAITLPVLNPRDRALAAVRPFPCSQVACSRWMSVSCLALLRHATVTPDERRAPRQRPFKDDMTPSTIEGCRILPTAVLPSKNRTVRIAETMHKRIPVMKTPAMNCE